ncbi:MAG: hypothetical protein AAFU03_17240, partial [Bacteroidota bacterium]
MLYRLFTLILLVTLLSACAIEDLILPDTVDEDDSESFFELKEETLVMSEETNQDILAYEEGMIAYRMGSSQLDSIEVGSVILSRPNTQAPGGFLEKVMGIATEGNRI